MLYLHLGFHKTASTHLQGIFNATFNDDKRFMYVGPSIFRKFTKWKKGGQLFDMEYSKSYIENISSTPKSLILSEENICGDSFDIFKHKRLYENIFPRLNSLSEFFKTFEEIEIFVTIRNPTTHLPSMYCEALRWRPYKPFSSVYSGDYNQSWVPVIKDIIRVFPASKINIMLYECYHEDLPSILKNMGGKRPVGAETNRVTRPSIVSRSIKVMGAVSYFIPKPLHRKTLFIIDFFLRRIERKKFQPFNQYEIKALSKRYLTDIEELSQIANINFLSRLQK